MAIRIIAPAETYTPPATSLSLWLIDFTSFRKFFFSADFIFDLFIVFISFNLNSKLLAFKDAAGFVATKEEGSDEAAAFD